MTHARSESPLILSLPLPPRELHPNHRPFTGRGCIARSARAKQYRGRVMIEAMQLRPTEPMRAVEITLRYYFARKTPRVDNDNLIAWFKAGFDGLVDGGLLVDDDQITHRPPVVAKDAADPRVEVEIVRV